MAESVVVTEDGAFHVPPASLRTHHYELTSVVTNKKLRLPEKLVLKLSL